MPSAAAAPSGQTTESSVALSLLSLSLAASASNPAATPATPARGGPAPHPSMKHRRLSSTGQTKRRQSDARDAAARPSLAMMQSAFITPSPLAPRVTPYTSTRVSATQAVAIPAQGPPAVVVGATPGTSTSLDDGVLPAAAASPPSTDGVKPTSGKGSGKKRSTTFTCESCSKVYRHPSCLIKHRWEHSPHWREASKYVISKHQQVQLLEAAAILSHISTSPTGTSLPEDRSLWPSFLSGGLLPPPSPANMAVAPVSSSMPARAPRMHDYALPPDAAGGPGITQVRPGLLGVASGPASRAGTPAVAVPAPPNARAEALDVRERYRREPARAAAPDAWGARGGSAGAVSSLRSSALPDLTPAQSLASTGGWSLPRSSVRSSSSSSSSDELRSRSVSVESEYVDVEGDVSMHYATSAWRHKYRAEPVKEEDEDGIQGDWAGMDMDMD